MGTNTASPPPRAADERAGIHMSRRPARFTEADVRRLVRAFEKEHPGQPHAVKAFPDGSIIVLPTKPVDGEELELIGEDFVL